MTKIRDILRLVLTTSLSDRQIGHAVRVSKNTARKYRCIAQKRDLRWEDIQNASFADMERILRTAERRLQTKRVPDWSHIHQELARPGVTLQLLWEEYREPSPDDAFSYSQFTHLFRLFSGKLKLSMRQTHLPGQKAFVDFSGVRPHYTDPATGERVVVELFVGVLGFSMFTFAIATASQRIEHWLDANVQMLESFGGVPRIIVPDNLKSAVTRPGREPEINRSYQEFSEHYDTVIMPARSRHPQDKAKVEVSVQISQRWILARLRDQQFTSLAELNREISRLCALLNDRPDRKTGATRRERLEQERVHLFPLTAARFEFAVWSPNLTVPKDYHVPAAGAWYSVPYTLVGEAVQARTTVRVVELFHHGARVASHPRSTDGGVSTDPIHQPPSHRAYAERTPERFKEWAREIGPSTLVVVEGLLNRQVAALGLPSCDSLRKLGVQYGGESLEQACTRAIEIKSLTLKSVKSLLSTGRYRNQHPEEARQSKLPLHHNVRGADYYGRKEG